METSQLIQVAATIASGLVREGCGIQSSPMSEGEKLRIAQESVDLALKIESSAQGVYNR